MKILYNAVDSEATGSQRVLSPLRGLSEQGLAEIKALRQDELKEQTKWADLIVLQCLIGPQSYEMVKAFKEAGKPIVIDYDDNFADLPDNILKHLGMTREEAAENWDKYLQLATVITTPSPYLAEIIDKRLTRKMNPLVCPTKRVRTHVLFNYLTTEEYEGARDYTPREDGEVRILYSCSDSHLKDFKWISSLLMSLGESYPQVRIISQGNLNFSYHFPQYKGKSSHELYAPYPIYHQRLRQISPHICLGPLLDNPHANSRSDIKFLQTASVKAVFVGSNLPPYAKSVVHGVNGYLANSKLGWWWYLRKLIRNPKLRKKMGETAYVTAGNSVLKNHLYKWYDLYAEIIK